MISLSSMAKSHPDQPHGGVPLEETLERLNPIMPLVGVTRLADVTGLDPLGIPVYSSIRPGDSSYRLYAHSGKGTTRLAAKVGAMMEAVEFFSAETYLGEVVTATHLEISHTAIAIPPSDFVLPFAREIVATAADPRRIPTRWVRGTDLMSSEAVWVPAETVVFAPPDAPRLFHIQTTNGLASGNTLEEAVSHGLAEVIERDACSIAEIKMGVMPALSALSQELFAQELPPLAPADVVPELDLRSVVDHEILALERSPLEFTGRGR